MNLLNLRRAAALTATALGVLAVPAVAGAAPVSAAPAADSGGCVARATGDVAVHCYATFTEALQKASGGVLTDGPKNAGDAIDDPAFNAKVDAANSAQRVGGYYTIISIEFDGLNYTTAPGGMPPLIWVGTGNCTTSTNNVDYQVGSLPAGFDNRISSFRTYANCWARHWENANYTGASVGYSGSQRDIGATMDNRTSSEQWS
jgi:hypothetical protein